MKRLVCLIAMLTVALLGCVNDDAVQKTNTRVTQIDTRVGEIESKMKDVEQVRAELTNMEERLKEQIRNSGSTIAEERKAALKQFAEEDESSDTARVNALRDEVNKKMAAEIQAEAKRLAMKMDAIEKRVNLRVKESYRLMQGEWQLQKQTFGDLRARLDTVDGQLVDTLRGLQTCLADAHAVVQGQVAKHDRLFGPKSEYRRRIEARKFFDKAMAQHAAGLAAESRKELQEASMLYRKGLALCPDSNTMRLNLAKTLALLGRKDEAVKELTSCVTTTKDRALKTEAQKMIQTLSKP